MQICYDAYSFTKCGIVLLNNDQSQNIAKYLRIFCSIILRERIDVRFRVCQASTIELFCEIVNC